MPFLPTTLTYLASETPKLEALRQLFQDWLHASVEAAPEMKEQIEGMVFDGSYPHYFGRKTRILFIGRAAREMEGFNQLDLLHAAYCTGNRIGLPHGGACTCCAPMRI